MKKSIITVISLFVSTGLAADNVMMNTSELSWVDEQVEAIKPARAGAKDSYLGSMTDPFIFLKDIKKRQMLNRSSSYRAPARTSTRSTSQVLIKQNAKGKLTLEAIINKSALIGGKWYKEGQSVAGYKIEKVSDKVVFLKRDKKTLVLSTKSKHQSLKFNNN